MGSGGQIYIFPKYGVSLLVLRERGRAGAQPNGLLRKAQMIMLLGYVNIIRETYINIDRMNRIKVISDCTSKLVQACKYYLYFIS